MSHEGHESDHRSVGTETEVEVETEPTNIRCVRTSLSRVRTTIWFAKCPWTMEEVPDGDGMWVGSAPAADHLRCARGRLGQGVAGPYLAARPGAVPAVAAQRPDPPSRGWLGGVGGGGLHWVALRGRGDRGRGGRGAPGRGRRHAGGPWSQASGQDRPQRRPAVAGSARGRGAAGELDPTRRGARVAGTGAVVHVAGQPAHRVVPAHPRRALPARRRGARGRHPDSDNAVDAGRRGSGVVAGGTPADHGRVPDDRRHRRRGPAAQEGPTAFRGPSAGVSSLGRRPVRHRRVGLRGRVVATVADRAGFAGPPETRSPPSRPGPHRQSRRRERSPQHQGHPRSAPATGVPASTRAGRPSNTDATALPPKGDTRSRLLSPTTSTSSSTQVTLGAPTPPTGPPRVCTGPRVGQGRTSSLRYGRSTLTNTCGPEPHRTQDLARPPSHR